MESFLMCASLFFGAVIGRGVVNAIHRELVSERLYELAFVTAGVWMVIWTTQISQSLKG